MFLSRRRLARCAFLLAAAGVCGCGSPRVVGAALKGNLDDLRVEIRAAQTKGDLDAALTRELALAVASRVVASSHGPAGASLVTMNEGCSRHLVSAYEQRARGTDATAAAATVVLLEGGVLDASEVARSYQGAEDPDWLAVGARAATAPDRATWRNAHMRHPDARVRRAALRASLDARSPDNLEELLAVSRLDPDPECRRLALRALGALGTDRSMEALQDRWRAATDAARVAVVEAWAGSPAYSRGGREALERAALGKGRAAVAATVALLRSQPNTPGWAKDVLARVIEQGTETDRLTAIAAADATYERTAQALIKASSSTSSRVRVAARRALLRNPKYATKARAELLEMAKGNDATALSARRSLAQVGDQSIVPLLEKQLTSQSAQERVSAALALTALGLPNKAAAELGEERPRDRLAVACAMLMAPVDD